MSKQVKGIAGWAVDQMVRRSVKARFHTVHWMPPTYQVPQPAILVANHHGWHDGYLMYIASRKLNLPVVDWIQEFEAFPLFGSIGGMPFPLNDPVRRTETIRKTIRLMRSSGTSLILFAEGELHRPDSLLPFGRSLEFVAAKVPEAQIIPVAIRYEQAMHERPEAYVSFGAPIARGDALGYRSRLAVAALLDKLRVVIAFERESLQVLVEGVKDVNERFDLRKDSVRR